MSKGYKSIFKYIDSEKGRVWWFPYISEKRRLTQTRAATSSSDTQVNDICG